MEKSEKTVEEFATQIVKALFEVAKSSATGGTAVWIVQHKGRGNLHSKARFIAQDGTYDNTTITSRDTFVCNGAALDWLKLLARKEEPLWEKLMGQADSEGNFNVIPIYPDDSRISELDLDGDALDIAHRILSE